MLTAPTRPPLQSYSLPTIVCRGNNVYGPHQVGDVHLHLHSHLYFHSHLTFTLTHLALLQPATQYPEKLIPKFLHLAMLGEVLPVHGSGMQQRSYLYVEDVASAYDTILHLGSIGETYNIGTSEEMTVLSIAQHICATYNLDPNTQIVVGEFDRKGRGEIASC